MFIEDLKNEFYQRIIGKRVLVIVNQDIDAICACKILQTLLHYDNVLYTIVSVMGLAGLRRTYNEHRQGVKYVILINCGGCIDILEHLQADEDVTFFVCDSHRPLDVCNIYSEHQVCIMGEAALEENIPEFDKIFYDSNDEDDSDDSDAEERSDDVALAPKKRSRLEKHEQRIMKQRARRQWETERDRIMFDYTQCSYYNRSSALALFELACKLSKDNMDLLWHAVVGVTEQLLLSKIESSAYLAQIECLQSHVRRLTHKTNDQNSTTGIKINFENDLHFVLYRHWTTYESICYTMYSACSLKLWSHRGKKRLQELLVEMGLPLAQARQTFSSMDLVLRKEFYSKVEKLAEKYGIPDIVFSSFTLSYGFRNRYAASDYVNGLLAILESSIKKGKTPEDCFFEALDALSRQKHERELLSAGIENSKLLHLKIFEQVQCSLETRQVKSAGSFFYYILNDEHTLFLYPCALMLLARFLLNGHAATTRNPKARSLPLIASCAMSSSTESMCLLVGIPPVCESSPKNFFGKAFEHAAEQSSTAILQDFFEPAAIQLKQSDLNKFLDALTMVLS